MNMKESKITCFGEVLWDVFPTHKTIGGAPLNVALRLKSFGNNVSIISKVGKDKLGDLLLEFIKEKGLETKSIQIDPELKTGKVDVNLDENGSASYTIMYPRAWDNIVLTELDIALVESSDAFIFGSLIGRNSQSLNTLTELLEHAIYKVFDVNLRPPHYTKELLIELMTRADFIKFNDDELLEISAYLGSPLESIEQNISYVSKKTNTQHICVTQGKHGAVLFYEDEFYYNSGYSANVVNTVGAGDSFLATIINYLLKDEKPQNAIDYACAVGALVTQNDGATPEITRNEIKSMINQKAI
nr:carbohydrate kinase [uncultured Psychroserpens sp.]